MRNRINDLHEDVSYFADMWLSGYKLDDMKMHWVDYDHERGIKKKSRTRRLIQTDDRRTNAESSQ